MTTHKGSSRVSGAVKRDDRGGTSCSHCDAALPGGVDYLTQVPRREGPVTDAGPHIFPDPSVYIDQPVVFRQYYCPKCYSALWTEVVPS